MFHATPGVIGRLKTGQIPDVGVTGIDVYDTVPDSMSVPTKPGPQRRDEASVEMIRLSIARQRFSRHESVEVKVVVVVIVIIVIIVEVVIVVVVIVVIVVIEFIFVVV